jgi:hypothetical protein
MDNRPGWLPDPEDGDRERYWNGSDWTDRVRPAGKVRTLRLPDHVPELQRALAGATADIDAVEDRLSMMFDRTAAPAKPPTPRTPRTPPIGQDAEDPDGVSAFDQLNRGGVDHGDQPDAVDHEPTHAAFDDDSGQGDDDAFAELDAALAAEEADHADEVEEPKKPKKPKRGLFRRRS